MSLPTWGKGCTPWLKMIQRPQPARKRPRIQSPARRMATNNPPKANRPVRRAAAVISDGGITMKNYNPLSWIAQLRRLAAQAERMNLPALAAALRALAARYEVKP